MISVRGIITNGEGKASELGFPTVNIAHDSDSHLPEIGIYAGILMHNNKEYRGVICLAPAQEATHQKLEIHCFAVVPISKNDPVECIFLQKVSEFIYGSSESMQLKIGEDIQKVKKFFNLTPNTRSDDRINPVVPTRFD